MHRSNKEYTNTVHERRRGYIRGGSRVYTLHGANTFTLMKHKRSCKIDFVNTKYSKIKSPAQILLENLCMLYGLGFQTFSAQGPLQLEKILIMTQSV